MIKKALSIFFSCIALYTCAFAQENARSSKFYYYTKSWQLITLKDSAYVTRAITPDPADSKLFIVEDTYYNGNIRLKGRSLTPDPNYKGEGDFKWYYLNGSLQETATYENGKISGERIGYYPDGNKQFIYVYHNGTLLGSSQFFPNGKPYYTAVFDTTKKLEIIGDAYDLAGSATAKNGNGTWVNYADTFKRVFSKGPIINGLKDGEWKGKLTDTLNTFVCIYNKGVLLSGTTYLGATGKTIQFTEEGIEPAPKGGFDRFYKQLAGNTKYPRKAKWDNVQGKVFLSFVIEKDGKLDDIKVVRGIGDGCDEAAVEALKKTSEPWIPGAQYGLPVRVQYNVPLSFTLQGGNCLGFC